MWYGDATVPMAQREAQQPYRQMVGRTIKVVLCAANTITIWDQHASTPVPIELDCRRISVVRPQYTLHGPVCCGE